MLITVTSKSGVVLGINPDSIRGLYPCSNSVDCIVYYHAIGRDVTLRETAAEIVSQIELYKSQMTIDYKGFVILHQNSGECAIDVNAIRVVWNENDGHSKIHFREKDRNAIVEESPQEVIKKVNRLFGIGIVKEQVATQRGLDLDMDD